jgi:hypothetical protein
MEIATPGVENSAPVNASARDFAVRPRRNRASKWLSAYKGSRRRNDANHQFDI